MMISNDDFAQYFYKLDLLNQMSYLGLDWYFELSIYQLTQCNMKIVVQIWFAEKDLDLDQNVYWTAITVLNQQMNAIQMKNVVQEIAGKLQLVVEYVCDWIIKRKIVQTTLESRTES